MKTLKRTIKIMCLTLVLGMYNSYFAFSAPKSDPPSAAENALVSKFPNATNIKWDKSNAGTRNSFVEFNEKRIKYRAYIDKDGNILEVQKEIKTKELPEKVVQALANIYPSERILKAYEIQKNGKKPIYEIVLKLESEKTSLTINKEGLFTMR